MCSVLLRSTLLHLCLGIVIRVFPVLLAAIVGAFISSSDPVGIFHSNHHVFGHAQILAGGGDGSRGGKGPSVQGGAGVGGEAGVLHLALGGSESHLSWESCRNAEMLLLCLSGAQGQWVGKVLLAHTTHCACNPKQKLT